MTQVTKYPFQVIVDKWTSSHGQRDGNVSRQTHNYETIGAAVTYRDHMKGHPAVRRVQILAVLDDWRNDYRETLFPEKPLPHARY